MWDMFVNLDLLCLWLFGGGGELATIMYWLGFACDCGVSVVAGLVSLSFSGCYWGFV